jgi:translation initiation factor 3 subunit B
MGTYLATFHKQGIQLWGGPKWVKQTRFPHANARLIDFSPCEKYLVTFSPQFAENDDPKDPKCIIVWDVRTGAKLRGFTGTDTPQWPKLLWSHDDKYFARLAEDAISVYETPSMGLLDKQSLKIPGVKDFSWSPKQNTISYFVPESGNIPAKVVLLSIPGRKELRQKNLFNVKDCKLHWHPDGKYLCVKVDRHTKTKKSTFVNFELFRVKEKDIPIELLEAKDQVHAFAWEPKGDKFAIIHGDNSNRPDVSFYTLAEKQLKKLKTIEKKPANALFWSPAGDMIILAGLRNLNGVFEFFSTSQMETVANVEHNMCTAVDWDPSGRYVSTTVSFWRHQLDTGYSVWTYSGKLVYKVVKDKFMQMLWRPRPPTLLPEEKIKSIDTNLATYSKKYEKELKNAIRAEKDRLKKQQEAERREFNKLVEEREKEYASWRASYLNSVYGRDLEAEDKAIEEVEEVHEELLENYEEVVEE